jgi:TRAP-type C4-dicarboxylate transport system substrate-binding protein
MNRLLAFAAALALGLAAASQASAQRTLKINESLGPGSAEEAALLHFQKAVEEKSKGALKVAIHLQDALGNPQTSLENLQTGTLELYSGALEYYAAVVPQEINIISLPYFVKDQDHLRRYLKGPAFAEGQKKLLDRGIRFISTEFNGERGPYRVFVSSKPILKLEDLNGVKIRMFPNEVASRSWKQLGTVPAQIAWTETYLAIRQGVVNGVTAPLSAVRAMKFAEVAPYILETREYPQTWPMTVSERVWRSLSPELQQVLVDSANEAGKTYARVTLERAQSDVDLMVRENSAVYVKLNVEPFRKRMEPLYQELIKENVISKALFDAVNALAN